MRYYKQEKSVIGLENKKWNKYQSRKFKEILKGLKQVRLHIKKNHSNPLTRGKKDETLNPGSTNTKHSLRVINETRTADRDHS